jgi:GDP-4-dehydro-6-deoxy-D-mannose reductase
VREVVLVTGAAGFAGSHLLDLLAATPEPASSPVPSAAGRATAGASGFSRKIVGWTRADVDLLDRDHLRAAIAELKPTHVYHLAGAAHVAESWTRPAATLATNILATHYLFDALRRAGGRCRVFVPGSAHVYAPSATPITEDAPIAPASPYAVSKVAQEQLGERSVVEDGLETVVARVFNHTGPRQSPTFAAPSMARQIARIERGLEEPVIKVGNLEAVRDLTDVRDTVRAYALLMQHGVPGAIYNVATGVGHSTRAVLDTLVGFARVPVRVAVDPARLRPNDLPFLVGDSSRLGAATGWKPRISFQQMLADLLEHWRGQS